MSLLKPVFSDGVVVKTEDLQRILNYTYAIEQGFLRYFGSGIIFGCSVKYTFNSGTPPDPDTIFVTVSGPAWISTVNKELIFLEEGEKIEETFLYPIDSTGVDIYIYESNIVTDITRQNLAGTSRPVSVKSVYSLSDTLPTPVTTNKYAKIATIKNPEVPITYESMITLQHTDSFLDGVYTGPTLDASVSLKELSITTDRLANGSVTTDKLANGSVTTDKLANGSVTTDKLANETVTTDRLAYGSVTTDKIDNFLRSILRNAPITLELPSQYIIPTQRIEETPDSSDLFLFDGGRVTTLEEVFFRIKPLEKWEVENFYFLQGIPQWDPLVTIAKPVVKTAHDKWIDKIGTYSWDKLKEGYTINTNPPLNYTGGTEGNILFNVTDGRLFPYYLYVIGLTTEYVEGKYYYLPHALKISSKIPGVFRYPRCLILRGKVPARIDRFINTVLYTVHTPFIIPPDNYRISGITFIPLANKQVDANDYGDQLSSFAYKGSSGYTLEHYISTWDAPLQLYNQSGSPMGDLIRGVCVKCVTFSEEHIAQMVLYSRESEEALMMYVEVSLERVPMYQDATNWFAKEPITGVYVWRYNTEDFLTSLLYY